MAFKQRTKQDVKSRTLIKKGEKKNGRERKYGTIVEFKDGKTVTLLTPSGRGTKFAEELKSGVHMTNDGQIKRDKETDFPIELDCCQRAFRSGYLQAQKDASKLYNAKEAAKAAKKSGGK